MYPDDLIIMVRWVDYYYDDGDADDSAATLYTFFTYRIPYSVSYCTRVYR